MIMMQLTAGDLLPLQVESDIVLTRQAMRRITVELGFGLIDQTKFVTAASELARNTIEHGGGGEVLIERLQDGARRGLRATFIDHGPGIADLNLALTDGYTTGKGMGLGLSGSRRLVNEFTINSVVGQGTRVSITRWR